MFERFSSSDGVSPGPEMGPTCMHRTVRIAIHIPSRVRIELKRLAVDRNTTLSALIRRSITVALQDPNDLAVTSMTFSRIRIGDRTTLDLPIGIHRILKRMAAEHETSIQALTFASIIRSFPDITDVDT